jgi:LAS superfamily LD-carboxypeptidase LdcB
MKDFKNYLEIIREEKEVMNEGIEKIVAPIMALSILVSPLQGKNNNKQKELHDKLQNRINEIISNHELKQEKLKNEITKNLNSLSDDQYKQFLDDVTKNKQIRIGGQEYELNISESDRQLVDKILGERKTYEPNKEVASKYILDKLGKKIEN